MFKPKHTVSSVATYLAKGLKDSSLGLPNTSPPSKTMTPKVLIRVRGKNDLRIDSLGDLKIVYESKGIKRVYALMPTLDGSLSFTEISKIKRCQESVPSD